MKDWKLLDEVMMFEYTMRDLNHFFEPTNFENEGKLDASPKRK